MKTKKITIEDLARITQNGFVGVDNKFDEVNIRLDSVDTRLDTVETRLDSIDTRLDSMDSRLDGIENPLLTDHLNRIERLDDSVSNFENQSGYKIITYMKTKKMAIEDLARITQDGFVRSDKNLLELESKVNTRFDSLDTHLDSMDVRLDRIENLLLTDHLNRIEHLEDAVRILKTKARIR